MATIKTGLVVYFALLLLVILSVNRSCDGANLNKVIGQNHASSEASASSEESSEEVNSTTTSSPVEARFRRGAKLDRSIESKENSSESQESNSNETLESTTTTNGTSVNQEQCSAFGLDPNPESLSPKSVCTSWTNGTATNAPYSDQCDCNWTAFHKCLCTDNLGWTVCLNLCKEKVSSKPVNQYRNFSPSVQMMNRFFTSLFASY